MPASNSTNDRRKRSPAAPRLGMSGMPGENRETNAFAHLFSQLKGKSDKSREDGDNGDDSATSPSITTSVSEMENNDENVGVEEEDGGDTTMEQEREEPPTSGENDGDEDNNAETLEEEEEKNEATASAAAAKEHDRESFCSARWGAHVDKFNRERRHNAEMGNPGSFGADATSIGDEDDDGDDSDGEKNWLPATFSDNEDEYATPPPRSMRRRVSTDNEARRSGVCVACHYSKANWPPIKKEWLQALQSMILEAFYMGVPNEGAKMAEATMEKDIRGPLNDMVIKGVYAEEGYELIPPWTAEDMIEHVFYHNNDPKFIPLRSAYEVRYLREKLMKYNLVKKHKKRQIKKMDEKCFEKILKAYEAEIKLLDKWLSINDITQVKNYAKTAGKSLLQGVRKPQQRKRK